MRLRLHVFGTIPSCVCAFTELQVNRLKHVCVAVYTVSECVCVCVWCSPHVNRTDKAYQTFIKVNRSSLGSCHWRFKYLVGGINTAATWHLFLSPVLRTGAKDKTVSSSKYAVATKIAARSTGLWFWLRWCIGTSSPALYLVVHVKCVSQRNTRGLPLSSSNAMWICSCSKAKC